MAAMPAVMVATDPVMAAWVPAMGVVAVALEHATAAVLAAMVGVVVATEAAVAATVVVWAASGAVAVVTVAAMVAVTGNTCLAAMGAMERAMLRSVVMALRFCPMLPLCITLLSWTILTGLECQLHPPHHLRL